MNKKELISRVADVVGGSKAEAGKYIDATFDVIKDEVVKGEKVSIIRFGVYDSKPTKEKNGHHPISKEPLVIPASKKISFKPSDSFKELVRATVK